MFRVQYLCPRQSPYWQNHETGLIWKTPEVFPSMAGACMCADALIWQYHGARVLDPSGQVVYQV